MKKNTILIILMSLLVLPFLISAQTRIACVGNSITAGYGTSNAATKAWPMQFAVMMGSGYTVKNFGVSGTTMLKNGTSPYWNTQEYVNAKNYDPQILIIGLGTNDAWYGNWDNHKNEFYNDYAAMINAFRQGGRNPQIYVCFPPPIRDANQNSNLKNGVIPNVQSISSNMGAKIIDFYNQLQQSTSFFIDGLHPNDQGAYVMAQLAFNAVTGGITNLGGTYSLQNRNSGMYMDIYGGSISDGAKIIQYPGSGGTNQQFKFAHLGNGVYSITSVSSGKSIDIKGADVNNGDTTLQWGWNGGNNQKFTVLSSGDGYYKIKAVHSGRIFDVAGGNMASGTNVVQWDDNNQTNGQWKFNAPGSRAPKLATDISDAIANDIYIYPNPATDIVTLTSIPANTTITVLDLSGRTLLSTKSSVGHEDIKMNIQNLKTGVYTIKLENKEVKVLKLLIK